MQQKALGLERPKVGRNRACLPGFARMAFARIPPSIRRRQPRPRPALSPLRVRCGPTRSRRRAPARAAARIGPYDPVQAEPADHDRRRAVCWAEAAMAAQRLRETPAPPDLVGRGYGVARLAVCGDRDDIRPLPAHANVAGAVLPLGLAVPGHLAIGVGGKYPCSAARSPPLGGYAPVLPALSSWERPGTVCPRRYGRS